MSKTDWLRHASLPVLPAGSAADTPLRPFVWRLMRGENLSMAESAEFLRTLLNREQTSVEQIAAGLAALAAKGETAEELAGMAAVMHERAARFETRKQKFIDISGTGASHVKTFNVSTAAAFVVAGAGLAVAKQANRKVASATGSAEVLEALGVRLNYSKDEGGDSRARESAYASFNGAGICFLSPSAFHGELNLIATVRRKLGLRTTFNLLGALSNPARPPFQIIGVWHPSLLEPMAQALASLGAKRAWVVHGADGLDEITLARETYVVEVANGKLNSFTIEPEDFGLKRAKLDKLRVNSAEQSAQIVTEVLGGTRRDEARSLVVLNSAAALLVAGMVKTEIQATRVAEQSLDSDSARIKLERLVMTTNK
ncbi:MAG TPA: anthranilate phosphoribosyltransferase [Pyrinomonadaceae bacterium]|jgi:anthranilate phosphoribosyltransferase|nr:anthranilate phosphoribosyltransferase [Pyrinomonadaceae bacterium]